MKQETKLKLAVIHKLCDAEDKSTEFMYQLMQDIANVSIDAVNNYLALPLNEKQKLFNQINAVVETINIMKNTNEIKKDLYKEKPIAIKTAFEHKDYVHYVAQLSGKRIVQFEIPHSEANFQNQVPAQLLIRWIV